MDIFRKYKGVLSAIALFLLLDASVLILNFIISFKIAQDAELINKTGAQGTLSQSLLKRLYEVGRTLEKDGKTSDAAIAELQNIADQMDSAIKVFQEGGELLTEDGSTIQIESITDKSRDIYHALVQLEAIWRPFSNEILKVVGAHETMGGTGFGPVINSAINYGNTHNLEMLRLYNLITDEMDAIAGGWAKTLRMIQTIGIFMALMNFVFIVLHFIRKLNENDIVIEKSREETRNILDTVSDGFFLVNQDLSISEQYSASLDDILGTSNVNNYQFDELLSDIISEKSAATAKKFIGLLFDPKIVADLVDSLNPLKDVVTNISQDGKLTTKTLSFGFKRVEENKKISKLLVTVTDITEKKLLEKQLEKMQQRGEQEFAMFMSFLHVSPNLMQRFLSDADISFNAINNILKKPIVREAQYTQRLDDIYREVHSLKGNAAALELDEIVNKASEFEDLIQEVRQDKSKIDFDGKHFLPLTIKLDELIGYKEKVATLADKVNQYSNASQQNQDSQLEKTLVMEKTSIMTDASAEVGEWVHLPSLANKIALQNGKQVDVSLQGFSTFSLGDDNASLINDICVQLIRNSMTHGIEKAEYRKRIGKSPKGKIKIALAVSGKGELILNYSDDGQGLDIERIKEKAVVMGLVSAGDIEQWDDKKIYSLVFHKGLSTAEIVDDNSGRGMGMDVIASRIQSVNGKIKMQTSKSKFTQFSFSLPIINTLENSLVFEIA